MQKTEICCACIEQEDKELNLAGQNGLTIIDGTNQNTMEVLAKVTRVKLNNEENIITRDEGVKANVKNPVEKRKRQEAINKVRTEQQKQEQVQSIKEDTSR